MLEIAEKIIEQQEAEFDPTEFKDRYEDALRDLIAAQEQGRELVSAAEPEEEEKVVDLMEALREQPEGRRRAVARQGRPLPRSARPDRQGKEPPEGRAAQAGGLSTKSSVAVVRPARFLPVPERIDIA